MAPSKVLAGARVVLPTGTVDDGRVIVDGTRITDTAPPQAQVVDLAGHWVVPGFVDLHNHGGGGASFAGGTAEEVLKGVETHRRHGTTTVVASAVTGDLDFLARHAGMLAELAQQGEEGGGCP
ncbi:N-acetylglucosamine-6-phosphate deacetylase OS=Streptomyces tendae OX=1932 GN=nagA PE=3 SV=1 [Streptomyces tendae]